MVLPHFACTFWFVGGAFRHERVGQLAVVRLGAQLTLPYPHLFPHLVPKHRPFARRCELARVAPLEEDLRRPWWRGSWSDD